MEFDIANSDIGKGRNFNSIGPLCHDPSLDHYEGNHQYHTKILEKV